VRGIGRLFAWIWAGLDGLRKVLHLLLLLLVFGIVWAAFSRPIPFVESQSALVVAPQGPIVEQLAGDPLERALSETLWQQPTQTLLRDVVEAIDEAKDDSRITALYLDLGGMTGGGIPKLREIADAIDRFRKSGKPVIAYGDYYDQAQYYLASHADEIYLDPQGIVYIEGYANYGLFIKDALDKLSIDWNVFRVGEYKSAVEMFTRNDMSPAEREESLVWLEGLWSTWKAHVAKARGFEPQRLQSFADDQVEALRKAGGDLGKLALDAELVTGLKGRSEVEEQLVELTGEDEDTHSYVGVDHWAYLANVQSQRALRPKAGDKVAVLVASGEILPGQQSPGMVGSDSLVNELRDIRFDDSVKAVVLRIDSPGGSVYASDVIYREILALRAAGKPVVASMSSMAASGGYYIAAAADRIVASPATLTGSIGIFGMVPTFDRAFGRLGIHVDGVGTTALSGELIPGRPLGEDSRQIIQQYIEFGYRQFVGLVAKSRGKTFEEIDEVAQGRVWTGADAKRLGLVDQLGGITDAVKLAAQLAKLGKDYETDYRDPVGGIGEAFGLRIHEAATRIALKLMPERPDGVLRRALAPASSLAERVSRLRDPRSAYAYCYTCIVD
jgi:protease-4